MVISDVRGRRSGLSVMPGLDYYMLVACAAWRPIAELCCLSIHYLCGTAEHKQATYHRGVFPPWLFGSCERTALCAGRPGSASERIANAGCSWGCVPLEEPTHQWSATCKVSTGSRPSLLNDPSRVPRVEGVEGEVPMRRKGQRRRGGDDRSVAQITAE